MLTLPSSLLRDHALRWKGKKLTSIDPTSLALESSFVPLHLSLSLALTIYSSIHLSPIRTHIRALNHPVKYWFSLTGCVCTCQVFKDYFGELEEESIRDNFVVVYELLDETMDFGYPQTCESRILREWVTHPLLRIYYFSFDYLTALRGREKERMCECVCVCVWEREWVRGVSCLTALFGLPGVPMTSLPALRENWSWSWSWSWSRIALLLQQVKWCEVKLSSCTHLNCNLLPQHGCRAAFSLHITPLLVLVTLSAENHLTWCDVKLPLITLYAHSLSTVAASHTLFSPLPLHHLNSCDTILFYAHLSCYVRVVTQESNRLEVAPRPPIALTNAVSWRSEGALHIIWTIIEAWLAGWLSLLSTLPWCSFCITDRLSHSLMIRKLYCVLSNTLPMPCHAMPCHAMPSHPVLVQGIKHRKNEIFLDVVEKLNLLVSSNGTVLHSEIIGSVQMKSFLSGDPSSQPLPLLLICLLFSFTRHAVSPLELNTECCSAHHSVHHLMSNIIFYLSLSVPHH